MPDAQVANAGVANGKAFERSFLGDRAQRGGAKTRRANGLAGRGGQRPLGRLGFLIQRAQDADKLGGRCGKERPAEEGGGRRARG